jgi:hypothetical protein
MTESRLPQTPRRTVAAGRSVSRGTNRRLDIDALGGSLPADSGGAFWGDHLPSHGVDHTSRDANSHVGRQPNHRGC